MLPTHRANVVKSDRKNIRAVYRVSITDYLSDLDNRQKKGKQDRGREEISVNL